MSNDALVFDDVSLKEIPVSIAKIKYVLREANGKAAQAYRAATVKGLSVSKDGTMQHLSSSMVAEHVLVSHCLFKEDSGLGVGLDVIQSWPNRIIRPLFDRAKEISDLDDTETKESIQKEISKLQDRLEKIETEDPNESGDTSMDG